MIDQFQGKHIQQKESKLPPTYSFPKTRQCTFFMFSVAQHRIKCFPQNLKI